MCLRSCTGCSVRRGPAPFLSCKTHNAFRGHKTKKQVRPRTKRLSTTPLQNPFVADTTAFLWCWFTRVKVVTGTRRRVAKVVRRIEKTASALHFQPSEAGRETTSMLGLQLCFNRRLDRCATSVAVCEPALKRCLMPAKPGKDIQAEINKNKERKNDRTHLDQPTLALSKISFCKKTNLASLPTHVQQARHLTEKDKQDNYGAAHFMERTCFSLYNQIPGGAAAVLKPATPSCSSRCFHASVSQHSCVVTTQSSSHGGDGGTCYSRRPTTPSFFVHSAGIWRRLCRGDKFTSTAFFTGTGLVGACVFSQSLPLAC